MKPFFLWPTLLLLVAALTIIFTQGSPVGEFGTTHSNSVSDSNNEQSAAPAKETDDVDTFDKPNSPIALIRMALSFGKVLDAINLLNSLNTQMSSEEIDSAISLILGTIVESQHANLKLAQVYALHLAKLFDRIDTWQLAADLSVRNKDWENAIESSIRWLQREYRPDEIEHITQSLIRVASQQRAKLEKEEDQLSIVGLYQRLHQSLPEVDRFVYELALAYLRVNQEELAIPLLEQLQSSPELAALAKKTLIRLEEPTESIAVEKNKDQLVVPLIRAGNNLLVKATINNQNLLLLLDTGASITSLSRSAINRLGLSDTGKTITLSTANGLRNSPLYTTKQLRLDNYRVNNLIVAEVDLPYSSKIDGLLGTDVLNHAGANFNYLIDNKNSQLIFREK